MAATLRTTSADASRPISFVTCSLSSHGGEAGSLNGSFTGGEAQSVAQRRDATPLQRSDSATYQVMSRAPACNDVAGTGTHTHQVMTLQPPMTPSAMTIPATGSATVPRVRHRTPYIEW